MQYFLSIKLEELFILGSLLIIIVIFGIYNKVWVKSNRLLYLILVMSAFMVGGNSLPTWWEYGAKHYDFIYNIGFSIISAFIFYWLTVAREEIKKREYYSFYSLDFLLTCYNLLSHFYLKEQFKDELEKVEGKYKIGETSIKTIEIRIDIPYYKIFEIIKIRKELIKTILSEYSLEFEKIQGTKEKMQEESIKIRKELCKGRLPEEIILQSEKNIEMMYSKKSNYIYIIYKKICDKSKEFKEGLNYYSNLGDFEEVDKTKEFLNFSKEMLNGELDQVEWFLKNFENIEKTIFPLIEKNIERLKLKGKYIPPITLTLNIQNFGIIDEYIIYRLIKLMYKDEDKFYYDYQSDTKQLIVDILNEENEYYLKLNEGKISFKDLNLREVAMDKSGVIFM